MGIENIDGYFTPYRPAGGFFPFFAFYRISSWKVLGIVAIDPISRAPLVQGESLSLIVDTGYNVHQPYSPFHERMPPIGCLLPQG
jgi:hypothetical protein